jgi:hypothetical protein
MTNSIENFEKEIKDLDLHYSHLSDGYGHWKIMLRVALITGDIKMFNHVTTDSMFIDEMYDLKQDQVSSEEIEKAYHERFWSSEFEEIVSEWAFENRE